jgi:hypothetical protein
VTVMPIVDPVPVAWRLCVICGAEGYDVRPSLAKLVVPGPDGPYQSVTRCKRAKECRARCESNGDVWPIDESLPRYQFVGES